MGIEAFGISMHFAEPGDWRKLMEILARNPTVRMATTGALDAFEILGEYDDGTHFIDFQMVLENPGDTCVLAARFSLCSHESIDQIFIALIRDILSRFEAEVWLMTSAVKKKSHYPSSDSKLLIAELPNEIVAMRKYWQNLFGSKQGAVRSDNSFSFVGAVK